MPDADRTGPRINRTELVMQAVMGQIAHPVIIESVEMLKRGSTYFVRTRSADGAVGITGTKQVEDFIPIFEQIVAPYFATGAPNWAVVFELLNPSDRAEVEQLLGNDSLGELLSAASGEPNRSQDELIALLAGPQQARRR